MTTGWLNAVWIVQNALSRSVLLRIAVAQGMGSSTLSWKFVCPP